MRSQLLHLTFCVLHSSFCITKKCPRDSRINTLSRGLENHRAVGPCAAGVSGARFVYRLVFSSSVSN